VKERKKLTKVEDLDIGRLLSTFGDLLLHGRLRRGESRSSESCESRDGEEGGFHFWRRVGGGLKRVWWLNECKGAEAEAGREGERESVYTKRRRREKEDSKGY